MAIESCLPVSLDFLRGSYKVETISAPELPSTKVFAFLEAELH